MFRWSQLVIQWHKHAAAIEDGISGNQPLGLIAHQDRRAIARCKPVFLEAGSKSQRHISKIAIGQAAALVFAVCLDQADFLWPARDGTRQSYAERFVLAQVKHRTL